MNWTHKCSTGGGKVGNVRGWPGLYVDVQDRPAGVGSSGYVPGRKRCCPEGPLPPAAVCWYLRAQLSESAVMKCWCRVASSVVQRTLATRGRKEATEKPLSIVR